MRHLALASFISIAFLLPGSRAADSIFSDFKLDLEGPIDLVFTRPQRGFTSVRTYITGPQRRYDGRIYPRDLLTKDPILVLTNRAEVRAFVDILTEYDNLPINSNLIGFTHHILLLDEPGKLLMHFRVFSESLTNTSAAHVNPRTNVGTGYTNRRILSWLVDRYRTNLTFKKLVLESEKRE